MEHSAALIQAKPLLMVVTLCTEYRLGGGDLGNGRLMVMSALVRAVKPPLLRYRLGGAPCSASVPRGCLTALPNGDTVQDTRDETLIWDPAVNHCLQKDAASVGQGHTGGGTHIWQEPCGRLSSCLSDVCVSLPSWSCICGHSGATENPAACWVFCSCVWARGVWPLLCPEDYPSDLSHCLSPLILDLREQGRGFLETWWQAAQKDAGMTALSITSLI